METISHAPDEIRCDSRQRPRGRFIPRTALTMEPEVIGASRQLSSEFDSGNLPRVQSPSKVVELMRAIPRSAERESGETIALPELTIPPSFPIGVDGSDFAAVPCDRQALLDEIEQFLAAGVPQPEPHRVLATVLIVGIPLAAPLAVHLGHEKWQVYSSSFAIVVRRQIERFGGRPRAETIDGIVSIFESPARAVRCASSIDSAARHFGFPVRSALHAGELEHSDQGLTGIAMQVAQRVFALGQSGEILVSGTIRDLVAGSALGFEEAGQRMQTPADRRWGLFRVLIDSDASTPYSSMPAPPVEAREQVVLSRREREVASLVAGGKSNRQIAGELYIARSTVERHVANILGKLGFHTRVQIAAWAVGSGLVVG